MKIKSIKRGEILPTWDIEVPNVNHYIMKNGCVSHNSANVIGSNEAFEAYTFNMYARRTKAGEFIIMNKHMIKVLEAEGLWNENIRAEIIKDNGSIQNIPVIEDSIKERFRTTYEISQKELLSMSADRAPFIDQTQSMNIFMASPTVSKLTSSHFYAWKRGLKTGMYYLRSQSIDMKAKHLGVDMTKQGEPTITSQGDFDCEGCSA